MYITVSFFEALCVICILLKYTLLHTFTVVLPCPIVYHRILYARARNTCYSRKCPQPIQKLPVYWNSLKWGLSVLNSLVQGKALGPWSQTVSGTGKLWGRYSTSLSLAFFNVDNTDSPLRVIGQLYWANREHTGPWYHIRHKEIHSAVKTAFYNYFHQSQADDLD